ncbi:MAG TPA: hypothetical protein DCF68_04810 [Cyanothece sp. UBA12306]|nr:hypothetical protein [Cyanothece sp. UBA12306]
MSNLNQEKLDFLLLMEDYQSSYTKAINKDSAIASLSYNDCSKELFSQLIYYGDAYINQLNSQGFKAHQVLPDCLPLQYKWAEENRVWVPPTWLSKGKFKWYWRRLLKTDPETWAREKIITEQIKQLQPKLVWVFSGVPVSKKTLDIWRSYTEKILLWWACPLAPGFPYGKFDLILSGIPDIAKYFRVRGFNAAHMPHAFDERILEKVPTSAEKIPKLAFVGSLSEAHLERILLLDALSRNVEIDFYGTGVHLLSEDSPLRQRYYHPVWGEELYSIYGSYLLVIHKNIGVAGRSFSAKRLFEATGMGACVITESTDDHRELFKPDEEIVTYSSLEECIEKIKYLLDHPQKAIEIGKKAQHRTLTEHTYHQRVKELLAHLKAFGLF